MRVSSEVKVGHFLIIQNGPRQQRVRVLAIRTCAWCEHPFAVTTRDQASTRAARRFCRLRCANRAGGITHDDAWRRKMSLASIVSRQRIAMERALAMMDGASTPAQIADAVTRIYRHAYRNGWQAGKKNGVRHASVKFDAELRRLNLRRAG